MSIYVLGAYIYECYAPCGDIQLGRMLPPQPITQPAAAGPACWLSTSFGGTHPKGRGRGGRSLKTWICAVAAAAVVAATAAARTAAIAAFLGTGSIRRTFLCGSSAWWALAAAIVALETGLSAAPALAPRHAFETGSSCLTVLDGSWTWSGLGGFMGEQNEPSTKNEACAKEATEGLAYIYIYMYRNMFIPGRQPPIGKSCCTAHISGVETSQFPLFEG